MRWRSHDDQFVLQPRRDIKLRFVARPFDQADVDLNIDTVLLAMAMAGLGLTTHVSAIRKAGIKPLALTAVFFVWLVCGGFAINAGITAFVTRGNDLE